MDIRRTQSCQKCKEVITFDKVHLYAKDHVANMVLCETCLEEIKRTRSKNPVLESKVPDLLPADYERNFCSRCNYHFRFDKSKANVTFNMCCPYCGKKDKLKFS